MKGMIAVAVLLALVAGIAVSGSRAQPVPRTSPALTICSPNGRVAPDTRRCQPVVLAHAGENEVGEFAELGDFANETDANYSDPEFFVAAARVIFEVAWRAAVAAASVNIVERAMDWAFGDGAEPPTLAHVDATIFDPLY